MGSEEKNFPGQDSAHFKLLLAELVAGTVSKRVLELRSQQYPHEFDDMDITGFYSKKREFKNKFLLIAHQIQLSDGEVDKLKIDNF